MRNSIVWKFASPPTDKQKETKLKQHLVKGKCFAKRRNKKKKKNLWDDDFVFPTNTSLCLQF